MDATAADLLPRLLALRDELRAAPPSRESRVRPMPADAAASAANLNHYLAFRRHDARALQRDLARAGLSSLGRSESCVLASVEAVLAIVERMAGAPATATAGDAMGMDEAEQLLAARTGSLLGPAPAHRHVRIMVTLPSEAASDPELAGRLVTAGMDCARINCVHDGPVAWTQMVTHVRAAAAAAGRPVQILMDVPGPKLRTGEVEPEPGVLALRTQKDENGDGVGPALAWLTAGPMQAPPADAIAVPVGREWVRGARAGDAIAVQDHRGRRRTLHVVESGPGGCLAQSKRGVRLATGTVLRRTRDGASTFVGTLPSRPGSLRVDVGDELILTRDQVPGREGTVAPDGEIHLARIPCTLPEAFAAARRGHTIWLDDGRFGGRVEAVAADEIRMVITHAPMGGGRLRAEKGINLPDSALDVDMGAHLDLAALGVIAGLADAVGLSFVRDRHDVARMDALLHVHTARPIGLVLKIEHRAAFEHLPELVHAAMESGRPAGVMIARGDLAIELGWERLAEVQEEILWLCEAAHLPVIWATQVLETLAKTGRPSRAEITDAAMGVRAECVMLNRGPRIVSAIETLDDILVRTQAHQHKKRTLLRRLDAWRPEAAPAPQAPAPVGVSAGLPAQL